MSAAANAVRDDLGRGYRKAVRRLRDAERVASGAHWYEMAAARLVNARMAKNASKPAGIVAEQVANARRCARRAREYMNQRPSDG